MTGNSTDRKQDGQCELTALAFHTKAVLGEVAQGQLPDKQGEPQLE